MTSIPDGLPAHRRPDLDWLRVGAFALLILYHVGMVFVTWDWHVKTAHPSAVLQPLMQLVNPWRLSLLFFISGAATRYMAVRITPRALLCARWRRLGPPLLFGMLVIVPPQSWVQVTEHGFHLSYWAFYGRYLTAYQGFCDAHGCLILPTWNHLWFVAYLLVYTSILLAAVAGQSLPRTLEAGMAAALSGWGVVVLPAVWLAFLRLTLAPHFPVKNDLIHDWYAHAIFGSMFLLGWWRARDAVFWRALTQWRLASLAAAACAYGVFAWCDLVVYPGDTVPPPDALAALRALYGIQQWLWIAAILGFGHRYLRRGGAVLDYLTQGVFPFYIVHQTIIVVTEYWLKPHQLGAPAEGVILVAVTATGCLASYELVRRVALLRPLFGLKPLGAGDGVAARTPYRLITD